MRTVIRYRNGVVNGKGASLLDGYMEDLATDRIYPPMIAHRVRHGDAANIVDDQGRVGHTPQLITRLFDEEFGQDRSSASCPKMKGGGTRKPSARRGLSARARINNLEVLSDEPYCQERPL